MFFSTKGLINNFNFFEIYIYLKEIYINLDILKIFVNIFKNIIPKVVTKTRGCSSCYFVYTCGPKQVQKKPKKGVENY